MVEGRLHIEQFPLLSALISHNIPFLPLLSRTKTKQFTHCLGLEGEFIDMELLTTLNRFGDMVMRFETDIKNNRTLFTDLNGHTLQEHRYKDKLFTQV